MQTISSFTERLGLSVDWAIDALRQLRYSVAGGGTEIDADQEELLIALDEEPGLLEKKLAELAKQDAAQAKKEEAAAKKKAAAEKKAAAKKAAAKKEAAKKPAAKKPAAKKAAAKKKPDAAEPEEAPEEAVQAEVIPAEPETEPETETAAEVAEAVVVVETPSPEEAPETEAVQEAAVPAAPELEPIAVILPDEPVTEEDAERAGQAAAQDAATEHLGALARAELKQQEMERQRGQKKAEKEKQPPKEEVAAPVPDPEVLRAVLERDRQRKERQQAPPAARGAARPGRDAAGPKTAGRKEQAPVLLTPEELERARARSMEKRGGAPTKAAKQKQKKEKAERLRIVEEDMQREAVLAVREFQSGSAATGSKKYRRRRRDGDEAGDSGMMLLGTVVVEETLTVDQLAAQLGRSAADIIVDLMDMDIMATKNQILDMEQIRHIADKYSFNVEVAIPEEERVFAEEPDRPEDLAPRPPVVTVMGHVDHGKTSLLDRVRRTNVADSEAGGITQHIAAYQFELPGGGVTFLDTPGHEAFTQMRARGAHVTDVVILVVAATDGVMPQTVEAIDHAKAAEVPIIVAVNKCDLENAQPDRVRQELTQYGLVAEEWGGDTIMRNISARNGDGVDDLMDLLTLQTELLNLRANPNKRARGAVLESEITTGQGPVAWVLVQSGTLRVGDTFLAGTTYGRVRSMVNARGEEMKEAGPSMPVVVTGFSTPPDAGDIFIVTEEERVAKSIAEKRAAALRLKRGPAVKHMTLEDFHKRFSEVEKKVLNVIVKGDVQGSVDVLRSSLAKLGNEEVSVNIVHGGVGAVNESDIILAGASDSVVIGFHVTANPKVRKLAEQEGVEIRTYLIIYEMMDDLRNALEGLLAPEKREAITGHAEIRQVFRSSALGNIAGCHVQDGEVSRGALARLVRDGVVVYDGKIESLRRGKDDAKSAAAGFECGIKLERFDDVRAGDVVEVYKIEQIAKTLD